VSVRRAAGIAISVAALHGLIAGVVASVPAAYGTVGAAHMFDDVFVYYTYASKALGGEVPYRDFPVEYPALAFPFFVLPRLVAADFGRYKVAFAMEMFAADAVAVGLLAWQVGRAGVLARRLAWWTVTLAVLCPLAVCRFDLLAMAWAFAAATAWASGRERLGGALAGTGVLVKIVPGVVALPAVLDRSVPWAGRRRGLAAAVVSLATGGVGWVLVGGPDVARSFAYHLERGVEIGSPYGAGLIAAATALGAPVETVYRHKSLEVVTPWSYAVGALGFPLQAAALLAVAWRARRDGGRDRWRDSAAAVLAFLTFGKVLSPQYLIWMIPFIARLDGRAGAWARGVFLLASALTTMVFPGAFHWLLQFRGWAVGLLCYRNVLLAGLWAYLTFGPRPSSPTPGPHRRPVAHRERTGRLAAA
jgi:hypothetical protein